MALLSLILPMQDHGISFISLDHLQFYLSLFYSFQHIGLSSPWLSLFLSILFSDMVLIEILFLLSDTSLLV